MGYVEVNLKIQEITEFNEDVLMLVIEDSPYTQRVPIQLGTLHINKALDLVSETELINLSNSIEEGQVSHIIRQQISKDRNRKKPLLWIKYKGE